MLPQIGRPIERRSRLSAIASVPAGKLTLSPLDEPLANEFPAERLSEVPRLLLSPAVRDEAKDEFLPVVSTTLEERFQPVMSEILSEELIPVVSVTDRVVFVPSVSA